MTSSVWGEPAAPAVLAGLAELDTVFDKLTGAALWPLSDGEVADAVTLAHQAVCRAQGLLISLIGEAGTRHLHGVAGSASAVQWLRHRLRMAPGEATLYARTATRIHDAMPATGEAMSAGQVSLAQAASIVNAVDDLGPDVPATSKTQAETLLIEEAARHDPVVLARLGAHIGAVVDPDGQDERDGKALADAEAKAAKRMSFTMSPDGEGGTYLRGRLDAEGTETLRAALGPLAQRRTSGPDQPDLRGADRRRADALVELARRQLHNGHLPSQGGERPQFIVTMTLENLLAKAGTAVLPSGQRITAAHARAIACDCDLIPAVLGSASQVLDVGRSRRLFTGGVRKAIILRDRGCAFPGCDRPPAWCECHHIVHWADGGKTCLDNGVLLCVYHHHLVERGDWQVFIDPADGQPTFTPPTWADPLRKPTRNTVHPPLH